HRRETYRQSSGLRCLPARTCLHTKNWLHTSELSWCAEIPQRSGPVGPEVRSWVGAALVRRCEWLSNTEPSTNCRPPRRGAGGGRDRSYSAAKSWRGCICQGFLSLRLPERLWHCGELPGESISTSA